MNDEVSTALDELGECFEGMIPSPLCTCSADGTPNVTYVSIVHRVGPAHVGLSFQFFNKTKQNLAENPKAQICIVEPSTGIQYLLDVVLEHTETEGALFQRASTQLDAIASQTGMADCFALRGLDVYRVLAVRRVPSEIAGQVSRPRVELDALAAFCERIADAPDLDALVRTALETFASDFGYEHAFLLALDEQSGTLYTLGSHGYEVSGIGSEVRVGEGLIGVAARDRRAVRTTHMVRELAYARVLRAGLERAGAGSSLTREIPLPGLPDAASQLAVPLLAGGRLLGVLCLQSATPGRFQRLDERQVSIAARHLASAFLALAAEPDADPAEPAPARSGEAKAATVKYFVVDDSVFIDDEYLIKGVAGAIFWKLLRDHVREGRTEFSNRELRLDPALRLPDISDNLEARLILLQRRLAERNAAVALEKTGRGRFRLNVSRPLELTDAPGR